MTDITSENTLESIIVASPTKQGGYKEGQAVAASNTETAGIEA